MSGEEVTFGRFRFDLARRELSRDGIPVRLGSRALDVLAVLAAARGDVVTKDELLARVWPGQVVEENNLQVQASALRKALDEGKSGQSYLLTVPGRGYRLIGSLAATLSGLPDKTKRTFSEAPVVNELSRRSASPTDKFPAIPRSIPYSTGGQPKSKSLACKLCDFTPSRVIELLASTVITVS